MTRIQRIFADLVSNKSATIRPIRVIRVLFNKMSCTVLLDSYFSEMALVNHLTRVMLMISTTGVIRCPSAGCC